MSLAAAAMFASFGINALGTSQQIKGMKESAKQQKYIAEIEGNQATQAQYKEFGSLVSEAVKSKNYNSWLASENQGNMGESAQIVSQLGIEAEVLEAKRTLEQNIQNIQQGVKIARTGAMANYKAGKASAIYSMVGSGLSTMGTYYGTKRKG